jgi:hypothetical protein
MTRLLVIEVVLSFAMLLCSSTSISDGATELAASSASNAGVVSREPGNFCLLTGEVGSCCLRRLDRRGAGDGEKLAITKGNKARDAFRIRGLFNYPVTLLTC